MYYVAMCEDETIFAESQEKVCSEILSKLNIEFQIDIYRSGAELLDAILMRKIKYDLLLLDIIMDGMNGMELARTIREKDDNSTIIFITSSRDYTLQGYDVKALHYLLKPVNKEVLKKLIESDYKHRFQKHYFVFSSGGKQIRVALKDIICVETSARKVKVTLLNQTVYYSGKLSELLMKLPKDQFIRCHQAYALNISHVQEFSGRDAIAVNGKTIPVSRMYAKDVKKVFTRMLWGR